MSRAASTLSSEGRMARVSLGASAEAFSFLAARQAYLDAMPLAGAVVGRDKKGLAILARNALFDRLDAAAGGRRPGVLTRAGLRARIERVLSGDSPNERFTWRDGGMIDGRHFDVAISLLDPGGGPRVLLTLYDRTSEVQTEESLRRQVLTDQLTGIANRAGFVEGLQQRMLDDGPENVGVILIDLARFSRVNECIGTLGGDELIITVARRLTTVLRSYDLFGRTGANEFAMAVNLRDGQGSIIQIGRRVEHALATPCRLSDFEIKIDCAVGCAFAAEGGQDAEQVIRQAQIALKAAKLSKRIEIYQPAALDAARRRFAIETELRRALERDALHLGFQPLMSLATGQVAGFEALARWDHPEMGEISPIEFIPVAEEAGLIVPLGRWALDSALRTLARWDAAAGRALPVYMGVNVSAIQIARDDVPKAVADALKANHLKGERLSVELTESAIIADPDRAGRTLEALKSFGAMVTMDDFGTGYSNLATLQRLPIDSLKIDRSYVTGMLDDRDKIAIVRAVLSLAQALGMTTTAEGVETPELARTLAALGCTSAQGWLFSPSLSADAAYDFLINSLR